MSWSEQQKGGALKLLGAISWSNLLGNNAGGGFEVHLALVGRWSLPAFMGAAKGRVPPAKGGWKVTPAKGVKVGGYPWCKGFYPGFSLKAQCVLQLRQDSKLSFITKSFIQSPMFNVLRPNFALSSRPLLSTR